MCLESWIVKKIDQKSMLNKQLEQILILKKGGINIKKKNRGKFTEYCGGKVTEECIAKGKKSKDPKIRKRATFAANARKWKHENGGILKAQTGTAMVNPFFLQTKLKEFATKMAPLINEHGKKINPDKWGQFSTHYEDAGIYSLGLWNRGHRLADNYKDHSILVKEQMKQAYESDPRHNRTNAQKAAELALRGQGLNLAGPWGVVAARVLSIPDQVYDWAASIAEPTNVRNHAHTAANYLDKLAKITPTKYDDYVAKIGELIGNADDVASGMGYDLFDWSKKKKE